MGERAQATVEYAGAGLLVLALLLAATAAARARLTAPPAATPPTWSWQRARRPGSWPSAATASTRSTSAVAAIPPARGRDGRCSTSTACGAAASPTSSTGSTCRTRAPPTPTSRRSTATTATTGRACSSSCATTARWSARGPRRTWGGTAATPGGSCAAVTGRAYPATVYRASGSHAGSLRQAGIDLAGDRWDGSLPQQPPQLLPADRARRGAPAFDPGATPPWQQAGLVGSRGGHHRPTRLAGHLRPLRALVVRPVPAVLTGGANSEISRSGRYQRRCIPHSPVSSCDPRSACFRLCPARSRCCRRRAGPFR